MQNRRVGNWSSTINWYQSCKNSKKHTIYIHTRERILKDDDDKKKKKNKIEKFNDSGILVYSPQLEEISSICFKERHLRTWMTPKMVKILPFTLSKEEKQTLKRHNL